MSQAPRWDPTDAAWESRRDAVLAEAQRFRSMIPMLILVLRDQWVVFREGQVHSVHATEEDAFVAGRNLSTTLRQPVVGFRLASPVPQAAAWAG
jgi:hypothetical protein